MTKNKKQISIIVSWLAVLAWMLMIYNLSSQPAVQSDELSRSVAEIIIDIIGKFVQFDIESSTTADFLSEFNHILRKFAHGGAYFVLALLVMNALIRSGVSGAKGVIVALLICILYATSDEVHQLFVPGRGGQVKDVLIDSVGAFVGVGLYRVVSKI